MTVVMPVWSDLQNLNYQIPCRFCRSSIKHKVFQDMSGEKDGETKNRYICRVIDTKCLSIATEL